MLIDKIKSQIAVHKSTFLVFSIIGVLKTVSTVLLNWLFIDLVHLPAIMGSSIAYGIVFVGTYVTYIKSNTIHKGFIKYTILVLSLNLFSVFFVTYLVDYVGLTGYQSSMIATVSFFLLRYISFHKLGILKLDVNEHNTQNPKK